MKAHIRNRLRIRSQALEGSSLDLRAVFDITFSDPTLVMCEDNDGVRIHSYTYGEMRERIDRAAAALRQAVDGAVDEYIALEMENSVAYVTAFWAILKSGNKPYLVNMRFPAAMSRSILDTLHIRYSVCHGESALGVTAVPFDTLQQDAPPVPNDVFADELAFSSSATSMNEVVCFYRGAQIAAQILNFRSIVKADPRIADHVGGSLKQLAFLPFYHIFGLFAVFFWFTFFGTTLVFLRDYGADTILKTCRRHRVTHIFAVPMLWHSVEKQLTAEMAKKDDRTKARFEKGLALATRLQNQWPTLGGHLARYLMREVNDALFGRSIRFCINGGSYVRDSALELLNGLGCNLRNGYGMSEIGITSVDLRRRPRDLNRNSIGRPFDAVEYRLGENNVLQVRGQTLCTRKLVNGVETALDGWFDTGDNMREENGYYYIDGRVGDMVIAENGENINPDTVEQQLCLSDAVAFSVLGLPSEQGEALSLVVQVNPLLPVARLQQLTDAIDAFNASLPPVSALRQVWFTHDELMPPTAIKVSRAQLRRKIDSGEVALLGRHDILTAETADDDRSPLSMAIREVIAEVLQVEPDAVRDDAHLIFDLGATSMQYFAILTALAAKFDRVAFDEQDTYRYTLRDMREFITSRM